MKVNFTFKEKEKNIGIKISVENYNYIQTLCKKYNRPVGTITRRFVEAAIIEHKKK